MDAAKARAKAIAMLAEGHPVSVVAKAVGRQSKTVKLWQAQMLDAADAAIAGALVVGAEETREIIERAGPAAAKLLADVIEGREVAPVDDRGRADVGMLALRVRAAQFAVERFVPALSEKTVSGRLTVSGEAALEKLRPLLEAPDDDGES